MGSSHVWSIHNKPDKYELKNNRTESGWTLFWSKDEDIWLWMLRAETQTTEVKAGQEVWEVRKKSKSRV